MKNKSLSYEALRDNKILFEKEASEHIMSPLFSVELDRPIDDSYVTYVKDLGEFATCWELSEAELFYYKADSTHILYYILSGKWIGYKLSH